MVALTLYLKRNSNNGKRLNDVLFCKCSKIIISGQRMKWGEL